MDYLQYSEIIVPRFGLPRSFKPYYKWITFNIVIENYLGVSNISFKPYYKWITFNIKIEGMTKDTANVSFKPYYKWITFNIIPTIEELRGMSGVLNLIINGLPSIWNLRKS